MGKKDPRVDAYIASAPDFAQPILNRLRRVVHAACPDVQEDIKWRMPHFLHHGMMCGMAAFKTHCVFGFWKPALVLGELGADRSSMTQFGCLTSVADLPADKVLTAYIKKAAKLNEDGVSVPRVSKAAKAPLVVPKDLASALARRKGAKAAFDAFPPSHRREYIEWITSAKRDETRGRRLEAAVKQIAEGKPQSWKYMK